VSANFTPENAQALVEHLHATGLDPTARVTNRPYYRPRTYEGVTNDFGLPVSTGVEGPEGGHVPGVVHVESVLSNSALHRLAVELGLSPNS
jgi:hypothetical protein